MSSRRKSVLQRDGWECKMPVCLHPYSRSINPALDGTKDPWSPTVDHVVPRASGGSDGAQNLRAAHKECNERRHRPPGSRDPRRKVSDPLSEQDRHLTYRVGDLFPGDQGSAWS